MNEVYLLPVQRPLVSLIMATALFRAGDREAVFLDSSSPDTEMEALKMLAASLESSFIDLTADVGVQAALQNAGLKFEALPDFSPSEPSLLIERFGRPGGWVMAAADNPADCLKAALLAVRLGCYFMPLGMKDRLPGPIGTAESLYFLGREESLQALIGKAQAAPVHILADHGDFLNCLKQNELDSEYLVLYNSADLEGETSRGDCLGKLWVKGLSLTTLILASYRALVPFDAATTEPVAAEIEAKLNRMVKDTGLKPRFLAVTASPAVIPFFYEEKKAIGAVTEEMVRDIHVPLNNDLFFDLAEGRLMQHSPAGLSVQLIRTKRYQQIQAQAGREGQELLVISTPHVDSGIIFAGDQALLDCQLIPPLSEAGYRIKVLQGEEAHYRKVAEALTRADFVLYSGHGGPEGLHTHGRSLNRDDLALLPPQVVYTSACSTVALVPHWYSSTEGLAWEGVAVDSEQVIGLSFVEKGALCFIGGATIEDLQYSTSIYGIFMEALLLKGLSVGEALLATRHYISLFAATLLQKNPAAYNRYRWGTANAIHQQILLGDPAFKPLQKLKDSCKLPRQVEKAGQNEITLTVDIPATRWRRAGASVNEKEASKHYYRCRRIEVDSPYGEDIVSWGDYYRVAPDADNISDSAVMSSFIQLAVELPSGTAPRSLLLTGVEALESRCLLCDKEVEPQGDLLAATRTFRLPYLLQPPVLLDMGDGWPFSLEVAEPLQRLHWLAPLLIIDEKERRATRLKKLIFKIELVPCNTVKGKIEKSAESCSYLIGVGFKTAGQEKKAESASTLTGAVYALPGKDGSFALNCAGGDALTLYQQFPLYDLLEAYEPPEAGIIPLESAGMVRINPGKQPSLNLKGRLLDSISGKPVAGGLVRVFRGEEDPVGDPLIEAYAAEATSDAEGAFCLALPAGKYMLAAAASQPGLRYKSGRWPVELKEGEDSYRLFALDQAALVRGQVILSGYQPPEPVGVALKRFPRVEGQGSLTRVPLKRDGSFECLVSFQERFFIQIEEEGWQPVEDDNEGKGYKLDPQEVLLRNYTLQEERL